ncbi:hypothetical protein AKO1_004207 [Acrasis kona]|uniref:Uncharacterized protein n=1 Tax=Acrasis kona TaxID=1008807 RepID=A0AAW2YH71_9EUKA
MSLWHFNSIQYCQTTPDELETLTYDRIVLGSLSAVVCLFALFQIIRTIIFGHKIVSFHFFFLVLCVVWMSLRSVYWFLIHSACYMAFLYWLPISVEFATFSLLLVFFTHALNSEEWNTPLLKRSAQPRSPTTTPQYNKQRNTQPTLSTSLVNGNHTTYNSTWDPHFIDDEDDYGTAINAHSNEDLDNEHVPLHYRFTNAVVRRDVFYFTLYGLANFIWCGAVLGISIYNCTDEEVIQTRANQIMSASCAGTFLFISLLLCITGCRLALLIRKQQDVPLYLKLSRLSGTRILVVIGLNSIIFLTRVIVNILPFTSDRFSHFLTIYELRRTDYGKAFLILSFVVWEIVPIITVLFFFSKIMPARSAQFHNRTPTNPQNAVHDVPSVMDADFNSAQADYENSRKQRYQKFIFDDPHRYDRDDKDGLDVMDRRQSREIDTSSHAIDLGGHPTDVDTESEDLSYNSEQGDLRR